MIATPFPTARAFFPPNPTQLTALRQAAKVCRGCDLCEHATQTVFGAGSGKAHLMFVGEQPGDQEDLQGLPFVGPAGNLLDAMLEAAGISRDDVYVTNAVKHFKFEPRGKKRLHAKPSAREVSACKPWLEQEIAVIKPRQIVCLGATAAQALLGNSFRLTQRRGENIANPHAPWLIATYHPSALLRAPDEVARQRMKSEFLSDLKFAAKELKRARHSEGAR